MKQRIFVLLLALTMANAMLACGGHVIAGSASVETFTKTEPTEEPINDYQQRFVDDVNAAMNKKENRAEAVKKAFSVYFQLTENDAQHTAVKEAVKQLTDYFDHEVEALGLEPMSVELDARISQFESIMAILPEEIESSSKSCEQLKTIRSNHFQWYIEQNSILAEKITKISKLFDGLYLSKVDELINETIPLAMALNDTSYEKDMAEIKQQFNLSSPAEIIDMLEKIKEMIPQMCYTDTYAVRFEYICDFQKEWIESTNSLFSYGYTNKSTMKSNYSKYQEYLGAHFACLGVKGDELTYLLEIGTDKKLVLDMIDLQGWSVYAVWVTPPYMTDEEKNWEP